jgi:TolA-binding protein
MAAAGLILLLLIVSWACGLLPSRFRCWPAVVDHPTLNKILQRGLILLVLVFILLVLYRTVEPGLQRSLLQAQQWYNQATDLNTPTEQRPLYLNKAQAGFQRLAQLYPTSPLADRIGYHWAMTLYLQGNYQEAIRIFAQVQQTKDSYYLADASYHLGMAAFRLQQWQQARRNFVLVADELKDPYWTPHALERLKEITEQTEQRQ